MCPSANQRYFVRGQIFTADAMLAFVFLVALLGFYFAAANSLSSKFTYDSSRAGLIDASETAMSALLSTSSSQNASLLDSRGFLSTSSTISFADLTSSSPERGRELLGFFRDGGGYDFSLSISDFSGVPIARCSSGEQPALESLRQAQRFAVLDDGRPVKITLMVWKK